MFVELLEYLGSKIVHLGSIFIFIIHRVLQMFPEEGVETKF